MAYPTGYQEAEHRRALDAILRHMFEQHARAPRATAVRAPPATPVRPLMAVVAGAGVSDHRELARGRKTA